MYKSISQKINKPLVSIVIPFHNTKINQFIELIDNLKQLNSAHLEFIFVNDHSNNERQYYDLINTISNSRCHNLADKHGVSVARNVGINDATGDYISFIDSDDLVNAVVFNHFINQKLDKDFYIFNEGVFLDNEKLQIMASINSIDTKDIDENIVRNMFINYRINDKYKISFSMRSVYCKFFKRDTIKHLFDEELRYYEDSLFMANYINDNDKMAGAIMDATLYYYRIDFDSASRKFNKSYNEYYQKYFNHYLEALKDDKRYLLPISFDSLSTVLPVKVTQAFKKLSFIYVMQLIKSDWAKQSARVLIGYKDDIDVMTLGITNRVNKKHYVSCLFYILCNRLIKSIKIRTNRLFKHGKQD